MPALLAKRISPDELRLFLNSRVGPYISSLPAKKVGAITSSFGEAAEAASRLGFDMAQVHGDRMCGSFSSSIYNTRADCCGGTSDNQAQFAVYGATGNVWEES